MKLVILDRDGVINWDSDEYIKTPDEWQPIPGSLEAIAKLHQAGFIVVVVTNQSGLARQYYTLETLNQIHEKMYRMVMQCGGYIDSLYFCPHHPQDNCSCRKPKTGLFEQVAQHYHTDLCEAICIGDSRRDIEAGLAMGCQCYVVLTGKSPLSVENAEFFEQHKIPIFQDLATLVTSVLARS